DPEPAVALDEVLHQLLRDGSAAADVGVVRRNVGHALRRAVRHQHDRRVHTRASTVASCTSSVRRPRTAGSALGGTPCPRLNTLPGRPPARATIAGASDSIRSHGPSRTAGSRLPCTPRSSLTSAHPPST